MCPRKDQTVKWMSVSQKGSDSKVDECVPEKIRQ